MMKNNEILNEEQIRKSLSQLKPNGEVFEIRIIGGRDRSNKPLSGYFKDADTLMQAFDTVDLRDRNIYITLNTIDEAVYSREQSCKFLAGKTTTSDKEIIGYDWLFIDLDPDRLAGVSSTQQELNHARRIAESIYKYLKELGFEEPLRAFSGNGCHLLYRIHLSNTDESKELVKACLNALSDMFSDEYVKVDISNFNPSRICKLYGTRAQKGSNTSERPHRMSHLYGDVKELKVTSKLYLEKLAGQISQEEIKPAKYNNFAPTTFDLNEFLDRNNIIYQQRPGTDCTMYILDECPFDSTHKAPDSKIFHYSNGAIAFKCHHNSCQDYTWQDVRKKYEPDAYEKQNEAYEEAIERGWKQHNRNKQKAEPVQNREAVWETIEDVISKPNQDNEYIKTHIKVIDEKMHGLIKGGISVWSGLRASGKSSVLSQIILNAINDDHTILAYSGELTDKRFTQWMMLQAAGKQHSKEATKDGSTYRFVPDDTKKQISKWIANRLYLYNNSYGSDSNMLLQSIELKIKEVSPDFILLDNLMTVDLPGNSYDEYNEQTNFMKEIKRLASVYNCHIALVAHPRKSISFLRLQDISGTGNIANIVDSAFIVHRMNHDFCTGFYTEFVGVIGKDKDKAVKYVEEERFENCGNIIEIAKDREEGVQDEFIPLWFEPESRRLKNERVENVTFGWTKDWIDEEASALFDDNLVYEDLPMNEDDFNGFTDD